MTHTKPSRVALLLFSEDALCGSIARSLAHRGYSVVIEAQRSDTPLTAAKAVAREIVREGRRAIAHHHDATTAEGAKKAVEKAVETFGDLNALVTCPSSDRERSIARVDEDSWRQLVSSHLSTTFFLQQAAVKWMMEHAKGGRLVAVTGTAGTITPEFGQVHHAAVMGGVCANVRALASEVRRKGITVNAVTRPHCAGERGHRDNAVELEAALESVLFFLSRHATEITGQILTIRGQSLSVVRSIASTGAVLTESTWTVEEIRSRWSELSR